MVVGSHQRAPAADISNFDVYKPDNGLYLVCCLDLWLEHTTWSLGPTSPRAAAECIACWSSASLAPAMGAPSMGMTPAGRKCQ